MSFSLVVFYIDYTSEIRGIADFRDPSFQTYIEVCFDVLFDKIAGSVLGSLHRFFECEGHIGDVASNFVRDIFDLFPVKIWARLHAILYAFDFGFSGGSDGYF